MNPSGSPEVSASTFSPGMPISCAEGIPDAAESTSTLYLKKPTRKSATVEGENVASHADARLWFRDFDLPPSVTNAAPPPSPNAVGPMRLKSATL